MGILVLGTFFCLYKPFISPMAKFSNLIDQFLFCRPHLLIMMVEEYLRTDGVEAKQRALTLIYKCYELLDPSWFDIHTKCHELMYTCASDLGDYPKVD